MNNSLETVKGKSFFDMESVKTVSEMTDVVEAKKFALRQINSSSARSINKARAAAGIKAKHDLTGILITMTNFFLAHPSENLSVSRASMEIA